MGIAHRSDHDLGLTIVVGDGVVTTGDWHAHVTRLTGDPEWPVGRLGLTDLSTADTSAITDDDIRGLANAFGSRDLQAPRKGAIVASDAAYRAAAAFQQARGPTGLRIRIFSGLDSACDWLGISSEGVAQTVEALRLAIRSGNV